MAETSVAQPNVAQADLGHVRFLRFQPSKLLPFGLWLGLAIMLVIPTLSFLLVAFSPALFDQGSSWLTLQSFADSLRGPTLRGLLDSLIVGTATSALALVVAIGLAWLMHRTTLGAGGLWVILIWALLLSPSYLTALGWESLLQRSGVLAQLGIDATIIRNIIFGPLGVIWVLTTKGVPFAYLAVAAGLIGLGREFEDAARVHGASPIASLKMAFAILAPALWSAVAIVFAESVSDFGVASTLAAQAKFPVATFSLYLAIGTMPIRYPVASAVGWFLIASVGLALVVQNRALKGRSFAVLSGRTRPSSATRLGVMGRIAALSATIAFFVVALGVPLVGAMSASLLQGLGGQMTVASVTLDNYRAAVTSSELIGPLLLSARLAAITATLSVIVAFFVGRILSGRRVGLSGRALDLLLLGAVALPSIVLAAGYIFAFNLPVFSQIGLRIYGTLFILGMAYLAAALPSTTRLLIGPLAQLQKSLADAARVHGANELDTLLTTIVPLLARSLLWAWLLTFSGTLLELPISQMLYPPGQEPVAVGITKHLQNYDFAGGSALMILTVIGVLVVISVALGTFRLLAPVGWQKIRPR